MDLGSLGFGLLGLGLGLWAWPHLYFMSSFNFDKTRRKNFKCEGGCFLPPLIKASFIWFSSPTRCSHRFVFESHLWVPLPQIRATLFLTWCHCSESLMVLTCSMHLLVFRPVDRDVFVRDLNRQLGTPSHWLPVDSCKKEDKGAP